MYHRRAITLALSAAVVGCASGAAPGPELGSTRDELKLSDSALELAKPVTTPVVGSKLSDSLIGRIKLPIGPIIIKDPGKAGDGGGNNGGGNNGSGGNGSSEVPPCSRTALWTQDDNSDARSCPQVAESKNGRWEAHFVFGEKPPLALSRACAYDWHPRADAPDAPPDLDNLREQLSQFGRTPPELDCPVLTGLAGPDPLDVALWESQRKTALVQAGLSSIRPEQFKGKTFVAVIDNAAVPFEQPTPADNYGHGRLVGRIIQDLTCSDDPKNCGTEIQNFLALPYLKPDVREPLGGKMGRREDLARAIHAAVDAFGVALREGRATQAVFNLSMGWDPQHGGLEGKPEAFSSASGTVYLALMRAACSGAITVAAAGNAHGPSSMGAVLPGGWETLRGPTAQECKRFFLRQDADEVFLSERRLRMLDGKMPLVTAVSAVDERDASLATTREHATPKFVAYGLSWVTSDTRYSDERAGRTDVLTGTSMSTAVASAAIADAWAIHPEQSIREVLALVYKSSVYVGHLVREGSTATLCGPSSCDEVVRISVCEAVRAAFCARGSCSEAPSCSTVPAGGGEPAWSEPLFERPGDVPVASASSAPPSLPESALCLPWTHGQPPESGCTGCLMIRSTGSVTLRGVTGAFPASSELFLTTDSGTTHLVRPASGYPDAISTTLTSGGATKRAVLTRNIGSVASPSYISEDIALSD